MEDKTKRIVIFLGSLFAAIIFVSSYAAFGNNSTGTSTTTTVSSANTIPVYGSANAVIVNYSYSAYVGVSNKIELTALNKTLGDLEANGSVSNYVPFNSTSYQALLSGINAYQLYTYLSNALNATDVSVGAGAFVNLPARVNMYYSAGSQVPVAFPEKNYSVYLTRVFPIGANVPVRIQALITTRGDLYNNQIRLSEGS
ncbi:MAG: hypothetical protein KGH94_01465 [Candidatus Micrarchaeota archaeon]|nr:hypothetical protein [Candidatus Micrarchaeota archaeon]